MNSENKSNIRGVGRRKTSTATITLVPNISSESERLILKLMVDLVNNIFNIISITCMKFKDLFENLNYLNQYKIIAKVKGGGLTGQADAIN